MEPSADRGQGRGNRQRGEEAMTGENSDKFCLQEVAEFPLDEN